ncbi:MAG TPA: polysaccharide biosynthesis C-terminal domain-containing protein [Terriglobales bacterium]|jgi:O-antigen/teichoic acid export membrane protein|nr:polysaccharide biosynthesis C-terminal domain-containing protein [Terriglobales bacterium]
MNISWRQLLRKVVDLGLGEAITRLSGIATLLILAHRYGVLFVGAYALAQGMLQYSYPIIDFGLRHVGARLIATKPLAAREIVRQVQRRRLIMASLLLPCLLLYAKFAKFPTEIRVFLFLFAATGSLYAASVDWVAWGKEHLRLAGFGRAIVQVSILTCLLLGSRSSSVLWFLLAGNVIGNVIQAGLFWYWWERNKPSENREISSTAIQRSLAWRRTSIMGLAWLCNLAFNTIDTLMLGVMSNAQQVGFYSVAYRLMNQILITYYLMTIALYPQLARQATQDRMSMLRPRILVSLFAAGMAIALLLVFFRRPLVILLLGRQFLPATLLLCLLSWAIPLDFLTSYLSNAYIAWGMEKSILACTAVAAGSNIALNLIWIPHYGATAAAVNTLISYVVFLASLAFAGRSAKELSVTGEPITEVTV